MASTSFGGLFTQAKASGAFDSTIPEGDYILRVIKGNVKSVAGKPDSIGLQLEVVRSDGDEVGRKVWTNLHFTEKAAPISFRFLTDLGLPESFIESAESAQQVVEALIGVEFDSEVSIRTWGKNNENSSNSFKVVELLVAPAVSDPTLPAEDGDEEAF
jgi:hypothetical protein